MLWGKSHTFFLASRHLASKGGLGLHRGGGGGPAGPPGNTALHGASVGPGAAPRPPRAPAMWSMWSSEKPRRKLSSESLNSGQGHMTISRAARIQGPATQRPRHCLQGLPLLHPWPQEVLASGVVAFDCITSENHKCGGLV